MPHRAPKRERRAEGFSFTVIIVVPVVLVVLVALLISTSMHSQLPIAGRFPLQDWTTVYGEELYNHSDAPVPNSYDMETVNIAGLASARATVADLKAQLIAFNTPT